MIHVHPTESKTQDSKTRSVMSLAIAGSNEPRPGEESVINHVEFEDQNTDASDLKPVGLNHVSHGTNRPHDLSDNAAKNDQLQSHRQLKKKRKILSTSFYFVWKKCQLITQTAFE